MKTSPKDKVASRGTARRLKLITHVPGDYKHNLGDVHALRCLCAMLCIPGTQADPFSVSLPSLPMHREAHSERTQNGKVRRTHRAGLVGDLAAVPLK
jgi:hypothetical protein